MMAMYMYNQPPTLWPDVIGRLLLDPLARLSAV